MSKENRVHENSREDLEQTRIDIVVDAWKTFNTRVMNEAQTSPFFSAIVQAASREPVGPAAEVNTRTDFKREDYLQAVFTAAQLLIPHTITVSLLQILQDRGIQDKPGVLPLSSETVDSSIMAIMQIHWGVAMDQERQRAFDLGKSKGEEDILKAFEGPYLLGRYSQEEMVQFGNVSSPLRGVDVELPTKAPALKVGFTYDNEKESPQQMYLIAFPIAA